MGTADPPSAAEKESSTDPAGISPDGQRGLVHTWAAMPYRPGSVVVGSTWEYFKASGFLADGDENERFAMRLALAAVPWAGLELSTGFSLVVNNNTAFVPEQTQSLGDPFLGVRYGLDLAPCFALGLGVQVVMPSGQGFSQLSVEGTSARFMLAADFRPLPELLIAFNTGYHLDNSEAIFDEELNAAKRFAAGVNPHDQFLVHLGIAWQLGPVAPFLEAGGAFGLGADAPGFGDQPTWLTLGLRAWPLSRHTLHLGAAVDIGLTGIHGGPEEARVQPYNILLTAGYDFGAEPAIEPRVEVREVVRKVKVEVPVQVPAPPPKGGRVRGKVVDAKTGRPLGNARVKVQGKEQALLLSDPESGAFATCFQQPGPVKLEISREGYRDETTAVLVGDKPGEPVTIGLAPSEGPSFGRLRGTVRAATGQPLRALLTVPTRKIKIRASKKGGKFDLRLATGVFDVIISAKGFRTQRRKIKLGPGDLVILNVEMYPKK